MIMNIWHTRNVAVVTTKRVRVLIISTNPSRYLPKRTALENWNRRNIPYVLPGASTTSATKEAGNADNKSRLNSPRRYIFPKVFGKDSKKPSFTIANFRSLQYMSATKNISTMKSTKKMPT
mmetsp:Transcript_20880/g.43576  ORF Transcript_20880/g.43576 Transcript_20880/m.43576 type:complete len:121 (-) Transcript_20880:1306-1668(-)